MRTTWRAILLCAAGLAILAIASPAHAQKTVILVRHADRDSGAEDALNAAGRERSKALAMVLKDAGITAILRSDRNRTREIAQWFRVPSKSIAYRDGQIEAHVEEVSKAIRASGDDGVVLYVGHSETVIPLLRKLGYSDEVREIDTFDNLFLLVPKEPKSVLVRLHY